MTIERLASMFQTSIWFLNLLCFSLALMPFATDAQRLWLLGIPTGILALFSIPNLFFKRRIAESLSSTHPSDDPVTRSVTSISSRDEPTQGDVSDNAKLCAAMLVHIHSTLHTQPLLKRTAILKRLKVTPILRSLFTDDEIMAATAFLTQLKMQAVLEGASQTQPSTDDHSDSNSKEP